MLTLFTGDRVIALPQRLNFQDRVSTSSGNTYMAQNIPWLSPVYLQNEHVALFAWLCHHVEHSCRNHWELVCLSSVTYIGKLSVGWVCGMIKFA